MKPLSDILPEEIAVVDCINIDDAPYHERINKVGLKCKDKIKCLRKSFGMFHLAVGKGFTTEFALRESTCKKVWIQ